MTGERDYILAWAGITHAYRRFKILENAILPDRLDGVALGTAKGRANKDSSRLLGLPSCIGHWIAWLSFDLD